MDRYDSKVSIPAKHFAAHLGLSLFLGLSLQLACFTDMDSETFVSAPNAKLSSEMTSAHSLTTGEEDMNSSAEIGGGEHIEAVDHETTPADDNENGDSTTTNSAEDSGDSTTGDDIVPTTNSSDTSSGSSSETETVTETSEEEESEGASDSMSDDTEGGTDNTGDSDDDALDKFPIVVPEVYSNGQRIGYLLDMDETAILKIWDNQNNRIFRLNEKTGYVVGTQQYYYFADPMCTIPAHSISSEGSECYHGSEEAAKPIFIEGGNTWGTIEGYQAKTYSVFSVYQPYYTQSDPDSECRRSAKPPNSFSLCLRTIEDIDNVPLSLPLPIEIRIPNRSIPGPGDAEESTLTIYSDTEYLGDFIGFDEEVISVYQPSEQRIFGINKNTGNVVGGGDLHAFSDDLCTQNLTRIPWKVEVHSCTPTTQGKIPHRSELWAHKGDAKGWEQGQYTLESTGPFMFSEDIYWTPWFLIRCLLGEPQCVQEALRQPEFPLSFPTPIEIRGTED